MSKLAVIQIRGMINVTRSIKDTMKYLNLFRKNSCVVVENNAANLGMILKVKDYVTWGELDEETFKLLLEKRGKILGNKPLSENYLKEKSKLDYTGFVKEVMSGAKKIKDVPGLKPFFRLHPPIKGFERGGIKRHFGVGGVLGYRQTKINDLLKRMI